MISPCITHKAISLLIILMFSYSIYAQQDTAIMQQLELPALLKDGNHEFSGICFSKTHLLLLAENRSDSRKLQTANIYGLPIKALKKKIIGKKHDSGFIEYTMRNIDVVQKKIAGFEGLEAIQIIGNTLFFSVETNMSNSNCYLIKGELQSTEIILDTLHMATLPKPRKPNGELVYNAGFESLLVDKNRVIAIFEYNDNPNGNYGFMTDTGFVNRPIPINFSKRVSFRITDASFLEKNKFIAINFLYPGNDEKDFRCDSTSADHSLIYNNGQYHFYARLLFFSIKNNQIINTNQINMPWIWQGTNWEGIVPFNGGYLMLNDKYTQFNKKQTDLIFVTKKQRKIDK